VKGGRRRPQSALQRKAPVLNHLRHLVAAAALLAVSAPAWAEGTSPVGQWLLPSGKTHVEIFACGAALCGRVVASPGAEAGDARHDEHNPDPALRARPLAGIEILHGLVRKGEEWSGGWAYNPGNGHIYDARLSMQGEDQLQVQGCVAFICKAQVWTRAP
jgi:uncharacterized protein (DUF2147 family)